jgi:phosphatidylserine decarboxylase
VIDDKGATPMKGSKSCRTKALLLIAVIWIGSAASAAQMGPCQGAIDELLSTYEQDPAFRALTDRALANVQPLPGELGANPWLGRNIHDMADIFAAWCTFLPAIDGSRDDGLRYIEEFAQFYYRIEYGAAFVQRGPGREITKRFVRERGAFMGSALSAAKVSDWLADPRIEREDYRLPDPSRPDATAATPPSTPSSRVR